MPLGHRSPDERRADGPGAAGESPRPPQPWQPVAAAVVRRSEEVRERTRATESSASTGPRITVRRAGDVHAPGPDAAQRAGRWPGRRRTWAVNWTMSSVQPEPRGRRGRSRARGRSARRASKSRCSHRPPWLACRLAGRCSGWFAPGFGAACGAPTLSPGIVAGERRCAEAPRRLTPLPVRKWPTCPAVAGRVMMDGGRQIVGMARRSRRGRGGGSAVIQGPALDSRWSLLAGDDQVGELRIAEYDMPWVHATFIPGEAWERYAALSMTSRRPSRPGTMRPQPSRSGRSARRACGLWPTRGTPRSSSG